MQSVVVVAGARPNFVKVAPVMRALATRIGAANVALVHTGQHYDPVMSGVFFDELRIPAPAVHLGVGSAHQGAQTGRIMEAFETYLLGHSRPDGVVVVGDVNSTLAAALAAVKLGIPVAHVEAGLRAFDRSMPEEINRLVVDVVSDVLFVSEPSGAENLAREGVPADRVEYVGNVMIDTLCDQLSAVRALDMPQRMGIDGDYVVVTLHRAANVDSDDRLLQLIELVQRVATTIPVVFPVHPRTATRMGELGLVDRLDAARVRLSAPLGYREFMSLVDGASLVLTDSGGLQEEASYLGIPCVTLRRSTERPVTVTHGTNVLAEPETAWAAIESGLRTRERRPAKIPGWDGAASDRIADGLARRW